MIGHHCRLGCCRDEKESKCKAWILISSVLLNMRPQVPSYKDWMKVTPPMRILLLQVLFHKLLPRAWTCLFDPSAASLPDEADTLVDSTAIPDEQTLYQRVKGARNRKATAFITGNTMVEDLLIGLIVVRSVSSLAIAISFCLACESVGKPISVTIVICTSVMPPFELQRTSVS